MSAAEASEKEPGAWWLKKGGVLWLLSEPYGLCNQGSDDPSKKAKKRSIIKSAGVAECHCHTSQCSHQCRLCRTSVSCDVSLRRWGWCWDGEFWNDDGEVPVAAFMALLFESLWLPGEDDIDLAESEEE